MVCGGSKRKFDKLIQEDFWAKEHVCICNPTRCCQRPLQALFQFTFPPIRCENVHFPTSSASVFNHSVFHNLKIPACFNLHSLSMNEGEASIFPIL